MEQANNNSNGTSGIKCCVACNEPKLMGEFYSKGTRTDSSCKACVLKKKQKSRKKLKAKSTFLNSVRKNSKVLIFSEDQIEEKQSEGSNANLQHLENLLRQFTFDSICRIGGKDGKK